MATFTERIQLLLTSDATDAIQGLRATGLASKELDGKLKATEGAMGKLGAITGMTADSMKFAIGAIGVGAVAGLIQVTKEGISRQLELADAVRRVASVSGLSAENASRLVEVTGDYGIEVGTVEKAMFRLATQVQSNTGIFKEHNVQIVRNRDGSVDLLGTLENVQQAFKKSGDAAERDRMLMDLFGKAGKELIPILEETGNLKKALADVGDARILSQQDLDEARNYSIAVDDLKDAFDSFQRNLGSAVIPQLTTFIQMMTAAVYGVQNLGSVLGQLTEKTGGGGTSPFSSIFDITDALWDKVNNTPWGKIVGDNVDVMKTAQERYKDALLESSKVALDNKSTESDRAAASRELAAARGDLEAKERTVGNAVRDTNTQEQANLDIANQRLNLTAGLVGASLNYQDALNKRAAAEATVHQLEAEGKQGTMEYAAAQAELLRADVGVVQSHGQVVAAVAALKKQKDDGTISAAQYRAQLELWKAQNPGLAASIDAVTWSAKQVPGNIPITVTVQGTSEAEAALRRVAAWIDYLNNNPNPSPNFDPNYGPTGIYGAEGAIVNRPTIALIGEAGPEALIPLNKVPGNSPLPNMQLNPPASPVAYEHSRALGTLMIPVQIDGRVVTEVVVSNLNRAGGPKITQRAVV